MADFPNNYPIFPVVVPGVSHPKTEDFDLPAREIEAVCTELGINTKTISDAVTPTSSPASVAVVLDMFATILKTISGAANWYSASVPFRRIIGGSGALSTVAAASTSYVYFFGRGLSATENLTRGVIAYRTNVRNLYLITSTAQPGTGTLVLTLRNNGVDTDLVLTIAAGAAAGIFNTTGQVSFERGDTISLKAVNNAPAAVSAQINGFTLEVDQDW